MKPSESPEPPDFCDLQRAADAESVYSQHRHIALLALELFGLLAAVAVPLVALVAPTAKIWDRVLGIGAAFCILCALAFSATNRGFKFQRRWYAGRALAESIKSESWSFAMRAGAYRGGNVEQIFNERIHAIVKMTVVQSAMRRLRDDVAPDWTTSWMRKQRSQAKGIRQRSYVAHRIREQHAWYRTKATLNERAERVWFIVATVAQLGAFGCSVLTIAGLAKIDWASLAATAATSAIAWTNSKDFGFHAQSYAGIAAELARLANDANSVHAEDELASLVDNVEHTISREHTIWLARKH